MEKTISLVLVLVLGLASVSLAAEDTWTYKTDMPTARGFTSGTVADGKIYVTGEMKKLFDCLKTNKNIFIDAGLDFIEDAVKESPTELDDITILPLCELVRKVLQVPDED